MLLPYHPHGCRRARAIGLFAAALASAVIGLGARNAHAAIDATTYRYVGATSGAVFDDMTGAVELLPPGIDDQRSGLTEIGFDFWFDGVRYTSFSANSNGLIRLGQTPVTTTGNNTATNFAAAGAAHIAPLFDDLATAVNGSVRAKVFGTAPNRYLVVEWSGYTYSFTLHVEEVTRVQAKLFEGTGVIEFHYGPEGTFGTPSATIGIARGTSPNFHQVTNLTTMAGLYGGTLTTSLGRPANGTLIRYIPRDGDSNGVPDLVGPAGAPSGITVVSGGTFAAPTLTLNWTNNGGAAQTGTAILMSRGPGQPFEMIGFRNTAPATDSFVVPASLLGNASTYTFRLVAVNEGSAVAADDFTGVTPAGTFPTVAGIGPTGTYPTLAAAFADMATLGLAGPTTLSLLDGYSPEAPLTFPTNAGPGSPITIKPDDGGTAPVFLFTQNTAGTPTFTFNNAKYITIDGRRTGDPADARRIEIDHALASTTINTAAVRIQNDSFNLTFRNVVLSGSGTSATTADSNAVVHVQASPTGILGSDDLVFDQCVVRPTGTGHPQFGIWSQGTSTNSLTQDGSSTRMNNRITVSNSLIHDWFNTTTIAFQAYGIYLAAGTADSTVTANRFFQTTTKSYNGTSVAFIGAIRYDGGAATAANANFFTVTDNRIGYADGSNTPSGIFEVGAPSGGQPVFRPINAGFNAVHFGTNTITGNVIGAISVTSNALGPHPMIGVGGGRSVISNNQVGFNGVSPAPITFTNVTPASTASIQTAGVAGVAGGGAQGLLIEDNTIGNISFTSSVLGVGFQGFGFQIPVSSNATIRGNTVSNISATISGPGTGPATLAGIEGGGVQGRYLIENNLIENLSSSNMTSTATGAGTRGINGNHGFGRISGNTIRNLTTSMTAATPNTVAGGILTTGAVNSRMEVLDNNVYNIAAVPSGSAPDLQVIGIDQRGGSGVQVPTPHIMARNYVHSLDGAGTGSRIVIGLNAQFGNLIAENNVVRLGLDHTGASIPGDAIQFIGLRDNVTATAVLTARHNTIWVAGDASIDTGADANTAAFLRTTSTASTDLRNNVFRNARTGGTAAHVAYQLNNLTGLTPTNVNFNAARVDGATFALNGATPIASYSAWNTAGFDVDGTNIDPALQAPNGALGVRTTATSLSPGVAPTPLEAFGTAAATTALDFGGASRAGLTPVDIGAFAGNFTVLDAVGPTIAYTPFNDTQTPTGVRTLTVTLNDQTGVETSGSNAPRLYYRKGISGPYSFVNPTTFSGSGPFTATFDLDQTPLSLVAGDVVQYYVAAQDTVTPTPFETTNPAGGSGINPPGTTAPATPAQYVILDPPLAGDYLVGASQTAPNFTTLTQAFTAFNGRGLNAPVRFLIQADYDHTAETFPLVLNVPTAGPDTTPVNSLTIRPDTGVTALIEGNVAANLIRINGVSWVEIDGTNGSGGRDLTIRNTNTSTTDGDGTVIRVVSIGTTPVSGVSVRNAVLVGGVNSRGYGVLAVDSGGTTGGRFNGLTVASNDIRRTLVGAHLFGLTGSASDATIAGNLINATGTEATRWMGASLRGFSNSSVTGNRIANFMTADNELTVPLVNATGLTDVGVFIGAGTTNTTVTRNTISDLFYSGTGGYGAKGIAVASGLTGTGITVANNFIHSMAGDGWTPHSAPIIANDALYGIMVEADSPNVRILANTIYLPENLTLGLNFGNAQSTGIGVITGSADIRNNIIVNQLGRRTGSTSANTRAVGISLSTATFAPYAATSNNNYVFVGNASDLNVAEVGHGSTGTASPPTVYNNLADWVAAAPAGADTASIGRAGGNPPASVQFVSATAPIDLHLLCTSPAVNAGQDLTSLGVTSDFDGDARPVGSAFDIGADETPQLDEPTAQPTDLASPSQTDSSITLSWTDASPLPSGYIVLAVPGTTPPSDVPADFTSYAVNDPIGASVVIFVGSGTTTVHTGLPANTSYSYAVFSYNNSGGCTDYLTTAPLTGTFTTTPPAAVPAWSILD